jgi:uncharacterized UPF0160 family protein
MLKSEENKKEVTIVTHSSGFHTDDIFAVATLLLVLGDDTNVSIVRSRDMSVIEKGDYVVDVGGIYDPSINRFDHHQAGGAGKRENGVPYASFGLVWKTYGEKLCGSKETAQKVDRVLIQPIDANDNGIQFIETILADLVPVDVGLITNLFNPTWKEDLSNIDDVFRSLVPYAKVLINRTITSVRDEMEAEILVMDAYNNAEDKRLIILESNRYPWGEVLSKLTEPLYVIYKNITDDTFSMKCVRDSLTSYESRKKLPESWGGKTGEDLEKVTGVTGAVFCHNARFMAVAKTKEAILKMAEIALNS